ncbi:MAG: PilZ domain-containing protein [Bryobacteraceae bacterium]
MIEQRKAKRFDLKLPVEVVRKSFQPVSSVGETKNMSAGGVMFSATIELEVGEPIEYIIAFPTHPINGGSVSLRCLGKVLRSEPNGPDPSDRSVLVAATLERYEFVRQDEKP